MVVGSGVIDEAGALLPELPKARHAFVVADREVVAERWFDRLDGGLGGRARVACCSRCRRARTRRPLAVYGTLLHQLATQEAHRDDVVVALGRRRRPVTWPGFVASTYMRGVPFVQVPTTLTAQVDAAIGGKTAVNLPEGKNLVGTFAQPRAVLADVEPLASLDERDFRSGLAEVAKYGLTLDTGAARDCWSRAPARCSPRDPDALEPLVARCVAAKARTVAADERDTGARLVLNYGHTLGHALERLDAFAGRTHGEAVAVGMVFAARLAERRGLSSPGLAARTGRLLASLGLETDGTLPPADEVLAAFRMDKKFRGGVRFVLLRDVAEPAVIDDVPDDEIRATLREMGATA